MAHVNSRFAKTVASVTYVDPAYRYVHARDDHGLSYFVFHSAFELMGRWDIADLQVGSQIKLTPIDHPKGLRGVDVEIVSIAHPLNGL